MQDELKSYGFPLDENARTSQHCHHHIQPQKGAVKGTQPRHYTVCRCVCGSSREEQCVCVGKQWGSSGGSGGCECGDVEVMLLTMPQVFPAARAYMTVHLPPAQSSH